MKKPCSVERKQKREQRKIKRTMENGGMEKEIWPQTWAEYITEKKEHYLIS